MDKNYLIQLTNELYRLTLLFPKKEPLRYKMRELADDILFDLISVPQKTYRGQTPVSLDGKFEVLESYFEVAKSQNWVSPTEILNLQKEYSKLREDLEKSPSGIRAVDVKHQQVGNVEVRPLHTSQSILVSEARNGVNERQQRILDFLKEKEKAQVWQIKQIFPDVSKRTLRRDFENLFKNGIVERIGERNDTFYRLKG